MAARTWLAVVLCMFVWFAYVQWFAPPIPPRSNPAPETVGKTPIVTPDKDAPTSTNAWSQPLSLVRSHVFNNGKLEVIFSDIGGKISEVGLRDYRDKLDKTAGFIHPVSPEISTLALGTVFSDPTLSPLMTGPYESKAESNVFRFNAQAAGVIFSKEYSVPQGKYLLDTVYRIQFPKGDRRDWGYVMIPVGGSRLTFDHNNPLASWEVVSYQNEKITRTNSDSLEEGEKVLQGNTSWVAFGNRYFSTAVINRSEINPDVVLHRTSGFTGGYLRYPLRLKQDQNELTPKVQFYVGPKDYAALSEIPGLKGLIDYGMFSFLAYPMLGVLRFFYSFAHNYGIAIILLTIAVRLLFYPLSVKSARSMKAMQKLQPQIQALKEKYKDDMQRFNQEQMALFKAHKVNPVGGCLPILVQIPVFLALYAVLASSIELFHAPFFGWIRDLSAKDPFYVFPVLMGVSMLVQSRMTPMAGMDPIQQKMMVYFMPVLMTFFMLNLPSGLTIYFFLSTMLGILQQWVINRHQPMQPSAFVAPP